MAAGVRAWPSDGPRRPVRFRWRARNPAPRARSQIRMARPGGIPVTPAHRSRAGAGRGRAAGVCGPPRRGSRTARSLLCNCAGRQPVHVCALGAICHPLENLKPRKPGGRLTSAWKGAREKGFEVGVSSRFLRELVQLRVVVAGGGGDIGRLAPAPADSGAPGVKSSIAPGARCPLLFRRFQRRSAGMLLQLVDPLRAGLSSTRGGSGPVGDAARSGGGTARAPRRFAGKADGLRSSSPDLCPPAPPQPASGSGHRRWNRARRSVADASSTLAPGANTGIRPVAAERGASTRPPDVTPWPTTVTVASGENESIPGGAGEWQGRHKLRTRGGAPPGPSRVRDPREGSHGTSSRGGSRKSGAGGGLQAAYGAHSSRATAGSERLFPAPPWGFGTRRGGPAMPPDKPCTPPPAGRGWHDPGLETRCRSNRKTPNVRCTDARARACAGA